MAQETVCLDLELYLFTLILGRTTIAACFSIPQQYYRQLFLIIAIIYLFYLAGTVQHMGTSADA